MVYDISGRPIYKSEGVESCKPSKLPQWGVALKLGALAGIRVKRLAHDIT